MAMAETDQARPLAPARDQQSSDNEESLKSMKHRRIKIWVSVSILLVLVLVIVILAFTVFKVKEPEITTKSITLTNLELMVSPNLNPMASSVKLNMSLLLDMSIKNPNIISFKFDNTTTIVDYHGVTVAEARTPPGIAKARRTFRLNVTVDVQADSIASVPDLVKDVAAQRLIMNSYTLVEGRVKILAITKHVEVRIYCTITVNISSRETQDMNCKRKVKL